MTRNALERIEELEKENAELKERHAEILEVFVSASSGDDFEMAECAREIMEILNIPCYQHGKVASKLTKAEDRIKQLEKENADLKARLNGIGAIVPQLENLSKVVRQQFSRAKDLLLRVIDLKNKPCASGHSVNMLLYDNICTEVEQFLEDVRKTDLEIAEQFFKEG